MGEISVGAFEHDFDITFFLAPQTETCTLGREEDLGIGVIVEEPGTLQAFIIVNEKIRTLTGIGVGSTIGEILASYPGQAWVMDVTSRGGGALVEVDDLESPGATHDEYARGFYFDTDTGGRVTQFRAGAWPWIEYDEYCRYSDEQAAAGAGG